MRVSTASVANSATVFPSPGTLDPRRPVASYDALLSFLPNTSFLGNEVANAGLLEMFRALFRRPNVQRVAGPQGELKKVVVIEKPYGGADCEDEGDEGVVEYLREDWGAKTPFPVTMKVRWDE